MTHRRDVWRHYLNRYRPARYVIATTTLASLLQGGLGLPIAWLLKQLFDGRTRSSAEVGLLLAGLVLLYLLGDVLLLYAVRKNLCIVKQVVRQLRIELVERVLLRPATADADTAIGKVHSALVLDAERIDEMSAALLCRLLPSSCSAIVLCGVLVTLSWTLFLVTMVVLPLAWLITASFRRQVRLRIDAFHATADRYDAGVIGLLQRLELARTHGAEPAEIAAHGTVAEQLAIDGHRVAWNGTALFVLQNQATLLTAMGVIWAGYALTASGSLTLGTLLAFYLVLAMARPQLATIVTQVPSVVAGRAALGRVYALIGGGAGNPYRGVQQVAFTGTVDLVGVHHRYAQAPVLEDVDLAIAPGRITALAGPNGAGKTTIARLVLGLERPVAGLLRAEGIPYDALAIDLLRARIGFAAQDPMIFTGTVRDNLVFGLDRSVEEAEIVAALEIVGADFVGALGNGFETWLGDSGVRLSGGQRQRLSIARAVLRCPALLILDEPTNHLGSTEARRILGRFRALYPGAAVLLITHDTDMLALADHIWRARSAPVPAAA